ncbi:STAS domain-containing protein [Parasediminibacterium sp. JCM 36343]|uniref:STAS domain-containing protein n=1 Tax=Parasediminibacterium sp. JCM 36343 TaxID=3374279 RepID=UPI00397B29A9
MEFKIDTKEKFTVITLLEPEIYDKMADELKNTCLTYLEQEVKNVVLDMGQVTTISSSIAQALALLQQSFYEGNASFVLCAIQPSVDAVFEEQDLGDIINQTPTESEAWDIVQMEEIERELLDGDDMLFDSNE